MPEFGQKTPVTVALLICLSSVNFSSVEAQETDEAIPFLPPEVLRADGSRLESHRVEFLETSWETADSSDMEAYVYVTVEASHGWGERQLIIDWKALTWNGTGWDRNLVSEDGLALRGRITPRGIPFGFLVESHYYPDLSNRTRVDPDGEVRRYETLTSRETGVHNEIVWPYLLAAMDLYEGRDFIAPGYNPYGTNPLYYRRFIVSNPITISDDAGNEYSGWAVDSFGGRSIDELKSKPGSGPGRFARYFVSSQAPHFLGKIWGTRDSTGVEQLTNAWRMTGYEPINITTANRLDEILEVRARRGADQEIPWARDNSQR